MRFWLKEKRELKGFTHEDVAVHAGISRSYYSLIESGNKTPSVDVAKAISQVLDFSWTIFFEEGCSLREHSNNDSFADNEAETA